MSKSADEFTLITYKKGKKKLKKPPSNSSLSDLEISTSSNAPIVFKRVEEAKEDLIGSDFCDSVLASLREGLVVLQTPAVKEIICFGLGRIGECLVARYQFALLLCLKETYGVEVSVFDPIFSQSDVRILEHFHCNVLTENPEGKCKVTGTETTIFYLPHCPKQLTNNLLWANWGLKLNQCIIIANSFNTILDNTPKRSLHKNAGYIVNIAPHTLELAIINTFKFYDIFNDTAIHIFPSDILNFVSEDFWKSREEPIYTKNDIEYITKSIE